MSAGSAVSAAPIRRVLVVGSGVMGRAIAASFAASGFTTAIMSRDPSRLGEPPAGVTVVARPPRRAPDLVIESVPEVLDLKQRLFAELEAAFGPGPILASNTSGLPLEEVAAPLAAPERFLGLHYFQPADTMELVEVIRTSRTDARIVERVTEALRKAGKDPLVLGKPVIGALVNRLQHALLHEAYHLIDEGIVTPADIDSVARRLLGPRMCVTGLIEQKDLSGLDTHTLAQRAIVPHLCAHRAPHRCLEALYAAGHLGAKTGTGFYDWSGRDVADYRQATSALLKRLLALLSGLPKQG